VEKSKKASRSAFPFCSPICETTTFLLFLGLFVYFYLFTNGEMKYAYAFGQKNSNSNATHKQIKINF
jgi:hypothetical protein